MTDLSFRRAGIADLPAIVAMLADDELGAQRESRNDLTPYLAAFERIDRDPGQHLLVADRGIEVVGTLQLSVIPGLSRRGATRTVIEAVRVRASERGTGLGSLLIEYAVEESRRLGADLVQLTSDASRADAHRFYERMGFVGSHVGFKLSLG